MQNLGFETLVTVLIPGRILFVALCLFVDTANPEFALSQTAVKLGSVEWRASLLVLVASAFLGVVLASLMGFVEGYVLEPLSACIISGTNPGSEWNLYIDSLEQAQNPYIARIVFYFFFELRAGAAAVFLGISLLNWPLTKVYSLAGWITILTGVWLLFAAINDHHFLAKFRHRRFGASTEGTVSTDQEEAAT